MLSLRAQVQIVNFIQLLTQGEEQIERARQHLAQLPTFEPYQAFKLLDRTSAGRINPTDLVHFLCSHSCQVTPPESDLIIKELVSADALGMCYGDFIGAILPWNNPALRQLAIQSKGNDRVGQDVEYGLCLFFEKVLDLTLRSKRSMEQMNENPDFSLQNWFKSMDLDGDGVVEVGDVKQFRARVGVSLRESDIRTAYQWLDKDRDGVLTLVDLQRAFKCDIPPVNRPGSALLDSRPISPLRSISPLKATSHLTTSPKPSTRRKDLLPTPSQSAETVSKSDFFKSPKRENDSVTRVVITYFKAVLTLDRDQRLLKSSCYPGDVSRLIVRPGKGVISPKDLEKVSLGLGLHITRGEWKELVERFDQDRDGCLDEGELERMILGESERSSGSAFGSMEGLLANVFSGLVEVERLRRRVFGAKMCDLYSSFQSLDSDQDGFVTRRDILGHGEGGLRVSFFDFLSDLTPCPLFRPVLL